MNLSMAETYEELWIKRPACLSEDDVFPPKELVRYPTTTVHTKGTVELGKDYTLRRTGGSEERQKPEDKVGAGKEEAEPHVHETMHRRPPNFEIHGLQLWLATTSCLLFSNKSIMRRLFVWIVFWKYTSAIVYAMILTNAAFLGLYDYTKDSYSTSLNIAVSSPTRLNHS